MANLADAVGFVREDVQKMKAYAPGEQLKGCIKLNTNECAWGPAPAVLKAVCSVTEDQLRLYPSPLCDKVRQAASEVFGVQPAQVLVGNGSDDCLTIIMRTFSQPGDSVACAWPTYSLYDTLASIQGVGIQHVDWSAQPDPALGEADGVPGWHLPITGLLQTAARVVFIANPNNPSATRVPLPALEYLATHLKGILVVDEAYIDYALDGDGMAASFLGKLDAYPNVIILRTFSKSYSMAGARLGLMFAHVELINHMNKVPPSPVGTRHLPPERSRRSEQPSLCMAAPPLRWHGHAPERAAALLATAGEGLVQRERTHAAGGRGGPA